LKDLKEEKKVVAEIKKSVVTSAPTKKAEEF